MLCWLMWLYQFKLADANFFSPLDFFKLEVQLIYSIICYRCATWWFSQFLKLYSIYSFSKYWLYSWWCTIYRVHVHACAYMLSHFSCVQLFATLWTVPTRFLCLWDSPGKNTGVSCHALLQGIFPIQGSNTQLLYLLHCRQILYPLSHLGSTYLVSIIY